MTNEIIKYFKCGLKRKLKRPYCGRYLSLWDDRVWKRHITNINISYINSNDFLIFLYQTKRDLSCIEDDNGQTLCNATDKFFYVMFDFETYFNIFLSNNIYNTRVKIIDNIIIYNQFNSLPSRLYGKFKYLELFNT